MKKIRKGIIVFLMFLMPVSLSIQSCEDIIPILLGMLFETGWLQDKEEMNNIPEDITPFEDDTRKLASRVLLEDKFPPIGDQGRYGTCVAWAVGYNLKTALNAIEKGWSSTQLASTANQTSPQDLWMIIPTSKRGSGCNGTNFEPALDAIISKGVATLNTVPYTTQVNCTGTTGGNANNKLANYRKIASEKEGLTVDNFKGYLNAGRPIAFGAKLGDRFMRWNSSSVISSDTYNEPNMQHAYHAMVLVGYDDNVGSRGAFRVRNSWGKTWGDEGSIWVDYNFFCQNFCFAAFVAQNPASLSAAPTPDFGADLVAFYAEDNEFDEEDDDCPECDRVFYYEVYNSGTTTIEPSKNWTVAYIYYNAFDANEYEIIYYDYYTEDFGGEEGDMDFISNSEAPSALHATSILGGYWNNMTVEPGQMASDGYEIIYEMPKITGRYYLVVMADAFDVIREANEDNNFYFITADNGKPLEFKDGVITNPANKSSMQRTSVDKRPAPFANTDRQTPVVEGNLNAYTPAEIKAMLLHDKKTGRLEAKRKAFSAENQNSKNHIRRPRKVQ